MKFRVAEPCPYCGCRCEEYNPDTGYLGCPQCERPRDKTISWEGKYKALIDIICKQNPSLEFYELTDYINSHGDIK